jgi:hypothetical protein
MTCRITNQATTLTANTGQDAAAVTDRAVEQTDRTETSAEDRV